MADLSGFSFFGGGSLLFGESLKCMPAIKLTALDYFFASFPTQKLEKFEWKEFFFGVQQTLFFPQKQNLFFQDQMKGYSNLSMDGWSDVYDVTRTGNISLHPIVIFSMRKC